jgi:hypothetical protein
MLPSRRRCGAGRLHTIRDDRSRHARAVEEITMTSKTLRMVQAPLYDFNEFSSLIGFQEVWAFEKKYASLEAD